MDWGNKIEMNEYFLRRAEKKSNEGNGTGRERSMLWERNFVQVKISSGVYDIFTEQKIMWPLLLKHLNIKLEKEITVHSTTHLLTTLHNNVMFFS